MKFTKLSILVILTGLFIYFVPTHIGQIYDNAMPKDAAEIIDKSTAKTDTNQAENTETDVKSIVKSSVIYVTLNKDAQLYSDVYGDISGSVSKGSTADVNDDISGFVSKGSTAELIRDYKSEWYYIKLLDGKKGWVQRNNLDIPPDPTTNLNKLSKEQLEEYVDKSSFSSSTKYLIWVDIDRQMTYIFQGYNGNWQNIKSIECSTGKNETPTIRGLFKVKDRGLWFYSNFYKCGAKYWVQFNDAYLFHSVPMDLNGNIIDPTLGQRKSDGCVRLSIDDSKWIYDNIPNGTTVFIN